MFKKVLLAYCIAETLHSYVQAFQPKYKDRLTLFGRVKKGFN